MAKKIPVGVLGATGAVGPALRPAPGRPSRGSRSRRSPPPTARRASRTARPARGACRTRRRDAVGRPDGEELRRAASASKLLFSGLDSSVAGEVETALAARATPSSPTPATTGWTPDVPLLIPEINADHLDALAVPAQAHGRRLHRDEPELQRGGPGHGPGAAAPRLRRRVGGGGDAAGPLRRRLSRRGLAGHRGQRRSPTSAAARRRRSRRSRARSSAASTDGAFVPRRLRASPPPSTAWR